MKKLWFLLPIFILAFCLGQILYQMIHKIEPNFWFLAIIALISWSIIYNRIKSHKKSEKQILDHDKRSEPFFLD